MTTAYRSLSPEALRREYAEVSARFDALRELGLALNMARGKPGKAQLDAVSDILTILHDPVQCQADGMDVRNYGQLSGLPSAKKLFAELLGCRAEECFIGGSASLTLMYDTIAKAYTHGLLHSEAPWSRLDKVKWLCPAPGYDRHFAICQALGIEMINVDYLEDGPDMDAVEKLVSEDEEIKGIWCVPMYSNPTGITYSDAVVKRFANLKPKAKDFRIFWDNAYCVHHLSENHDHLLNIIEECKKAGNPNMVFEFTSTSKISFPGGGLAVVAASKENIDFIKSQMTYQTIGFDKLNQLRHAKYFKNFESISEHMKHHAAIIRPKFDVVLYMLDKEIEPLGIGKWNKPNGGYFISFDALPGCAKRIVSLAKEAGVVMTGAGATFPYGKDPKDSNIRIAPTFPSVDELRQAMEIFCVCVKLASVEVLLNK